MDDKKLEKISLSEFENKNIDFENREIAEYSMQGYSNVSVPSWRQTFKEIIQRLYEEDPSIFKKEIFKYEDKKSNNNIKKRMWTADPKLFEIPTKKGDYASVKVSGNMHMDDVYISSVYSANGNASKIVELIDTYHQKNILLHIKKEDIVFHLEPVKS